MIDEDTRTEVTAAILSTLHGTPSTPHRGRIEAIVRAEVAAWERHDGAAVVRLNEEARGVALADAGALVVTCAELLRQLAQERNLTADRLLEAVMARLG